MITLEEFLEETSFEDMLPLAKCSAYVTRESWQKVEETKGQVIVWGKELFRSYGAYADDHWKLEENGDFDFSKYVDDFRKEYPEEWYVMNIAIGKNRDKNPTPYTMTEEDLKAIDWRGW